ncbi:MAG: SUF system NifU family Fe-S cluster assembly protein [Candidatus Dormiibacterota bacterium]
MTVGIAPLDDELFREIILDHYRNPRHRGQVAGADGTLEADNPLCGDEIQLSWRFDSERLAEIAFTGRGCSISQAAASMLCDEVAGLPCAQAASLARRYREMLVADGKADGLGDLEALRGVRAYPVRIKCATLACNALLQALAQTEGDAA